MSRSIPILLYHRIDHTSLSTATSPQVFRRHMQWLSERGWRSLSAQEFAFFTRAGKTLPSHSFVITFDDGYASIASVALPILEEFGYKAISFVSTGFLRDPEGMKGSPIDADTRDFLNWDQVRELQASGVIDFQSHTHSHRRFSECSAAEIAQDLGTSLDFLSHELALPRSHFTHLAWPWGDSKAEWRAAASRCGFKYQYTVSRQSFAQGSSLVEIPRTCFDATAFTQFQTQLWLQVGQLAPMWRAAYPVGRKLRHVSGMIFP